MGGVSTASHVAYKTSSGQDIDKYEVIGAFAGRALTRNHTIGNQIRINIDITTVSSLSKDPSGNSLNSDYFGAISSPISGALFNQVPVVGKKLGPMATEYFSDLESLEKSYNYFKNNYENKRGSDE